MQRLMRMLQIRSHAPGLRFPTYRGVSAPSQIWTVARVCATYAAFGLSPAELDQILLN
jgi:hypothetical protein